MNWLLKLLIVSAPWAVVVGALGYWKYWPTMDELREENVAWVNELAHELPRHGVAPDRASAVALPCDSCDLGAWAKEVHMRVAAAEPSPGASPRGYYKAAVEANRRLDAVPKELEKLKRVQHETLLGLVQIWACSVPFLLIVLMLFPRVKAWITT